VAKNDNRLLPSKEVVGTCLSRTIKVRFDGDTIIATITRAAPGSAAEERSERADNYIMKKLRRERERAEPIILTPRAQAGKAFVEKSFHSITGSIQLEHCVDIIVEALCRFIRRAEQAARTDKGICPQPAAAHPARLSRGARKTFFPLAD
jgi:hypothetical protein